VWWQLALVRFYHGFATAIFVPVAEATIAEIYPTKRGERISTFNSFTAVGRAVAPFLGGSILFITNNGLHTLYLAVGIAGVSSFIVALLLLSERKTAIIVSAKEKVMMGQMLKGWIEIARNKGAIVTSFVQSIQYYVYGVVEYYFVKYMKDVAGFNALEYGAVIGIQIVSLIVSRPLIGRLSDRSNRRMPIVIGCIISAVTLFIIPFTTQFALLLIISIGYGLGFAMVISSTTPLMCDLTPSNKIGASMGFLSTMMDVGQVLGPIISALILSTALEYNGLFSSLTLLLAVSAVVFFFSGVAIARREDHYLNNETSFKK
jgi:MFS family permease